MLDHDVVHWCAFRTVYQFYTGRNVYVYDGGNNLFSWYVYRIVMVYHDKYTSGSEKL